MTPSPRDPDPPPAGQGRESHDEMHGTSRFQIFDGRVQRFKELVEECIGIVREHDTGTLEYRIYINAAGTEAFVHERYRDSAAGLEHMHNISRMMEPLATVCTMTGEVCGEPTDELREALEAAGVAVYSPLASSD